MSAADSVAAHDLRTAETRVFGKWLTAAEHRYGATPIGLDLATWLQSDPLPRQALQFPKQEWATNPARRTVILAICEEMLDRIDELTEAQWMTLSFLIQYGGRTPL